MQNEAPKKYKPRASADQASITLVNGDAPITIDEAVELWPALSRNELADAIRSGELSGRIRGGSRAPLTTRQSIIVWLRESKGSTHAAD
jgi:hypothetical protein